MTLLPLIQTIKREGISAETNSRDTVWGRGSIIRVIWMQVLKRDWLKGNRIQVDGEPITCITTSS
jgi:hypothetical protein